MRWGQLLLLVSFCFFHDVPLGCPRTLSRVLRDGRREWERERERYTPEDCSTCRWKFGSAIFTLARLPWAVKHRVEGDTCLKLINDYVDYVAFDVSRIVNDIKKVF